MTETRTPPTPEEFRAHIRQHVQQMTSSTQSAGFEIAAMLRMLANMYENVHLQGDEDAGISGRRIGVLFRLLGEENHGKTGGLTPTQLSIDQNVSRNTISSLLRGLEQQGLIRRQLDPHDRRHFRIHLTADGRSLVKELGPRRIEAVNRIASPLTPREQEQLLDLLGKLMRSLQAACRCGQAPNPGASAHT